MNESKKIEWRKFELTVPLTRATCIKHEVAVPMQWDEEIKMWFLTPEAHRIIDIRKLQIMVTHLLEQIDAILQKG